MSQSERRTINRLLRSMRQIVRGAEETVKGSYPDLKTFARQEPASYAVLKEARASMRVAAAALGKA